METITLQYQPKTMTDLADLACRLVTAPSSITAAEKRYLAAIVTVVIECMPDGSDEPLTPKYIGRVLSRDQ